MRDGVFVTFGIFECLWGLLFVTGVMCRLEVGKKIVATKPHRLPC